MYFLYTIPHYSRSTVISFCVREEGDVFVPKLLRYTRINNGHILWVFGEFFKDVRPCLPLVGVVSDHLFTFRKRTVSGRGVVSCFIIPSLGILLTLCVGYKTEDPTFFERRQKGLRFIVLVPWSNPRQFLFLIVLGLRRHSVCDPSRGHGTG